MTNITNHSQLNFQGLVKEIHSDVINDDLESLKSRRSGGNIPSIVYYGKDANGLTPLHKVSSFDFRTSGFILNLISSRQAAGLGRTEIAEYILEQTPKSLAATDNEGRTPLHYSSLLKDNGKMASFLIENGADESALDSVSYFSKSAIILLSNTSNCRNKKRLPTIKPEHQS